MLGGARNGAGLDGHAFLAAVLSGSASPFAMEGRRLKAVEKRSETLRKRTMQNGLKTTQNCSKTKNGKDFKVGSCRR